MTSNGWSGKLHVGPSVLKGNTMTVWFYTLNIQVSYYKSLTLIGV